MLQGLLSTYSPYGMQRNSGQPLSHAKPEPSDQGNRIKRRKPSKAEIDAATSKAIKTQLGDMVARLNSKRYIQEREIRFQLEDQDTRKRPMIEMIHEPTESVLNRFGFQDLMKLERSLFDMAGFRMNFTT